MRQPTVALLTSPDIRVRHPAAELDVEGQIGWDRRSPDQSETTIRHSAASQNHTKCLEWAAWGGQRSGRCRGPGVAVLELLRAEIAQSGMETASVVDVVDEPWKVLGDVGEGFVGHRIDGFDLERLHEALGLGVVIGIASAPHRADKAAAKQGFPIGLSGVLGGFRWLSQHLD